MNVVGYFNTSNGSSLDADCILAYTDAAEDKTSSMVGDLNDAIVSVLCEEDVATVIAHTQSFAGMGSQVSILWPYPWYFFLLVLLFFFFSIIYLFIFI